MLDNINDIENIVMSPLADPVINAIFIDKDNAGLAAESMIRAVLEADGEALQGEILSVTPQRFHGSPDGRGCRVDVEIVTARNERVIVEVQITSESWIAQRNLFSVSRIIAETSVSGTTSRQMAEALPKFIFIDILNYIKRKKNAELIQPIKQMYTKPPYEVALDTVKIYEVQLPRIAEMEADFNNAWHCWFYAMYTAHKENKTISEVIEMTPQLQTYAERDAGFRQYCDQYKRVSADPNTKNEYLRWKEEQIRLAGMTHAAVEDALEVERDKWQGVVAEKDAALANKDAELAKQAELIAKLQAQINKKD